MPTTIHRPLAAFTLLAIFAATASATTGVLLARSSLKVSIRGHAHLVLLANPAHGQRIRLVVPNTDPLGDFDPVPDQRQIIQSLKPNDLVQASWQSVNGFNMLDSIALYTPKPGEATPNGYVFRLSQLKEKSDDLEVHLDKLGDSTIALIPGSKDSDGKATHDPLLIAAISTLNEGDPVWVDLTPSVPPQVVAILPYTDPQRGKIASIHTTQAEGHSNVSVEIDSADGKLDALIPGSMLKDVWIPNARLLAVARTSQPGDVVLFRTQQDEKHLWLRDLQVQRAAPVAAPVARNASHSTSNNPNNTPNSDPNGIHRTVPGASGVPGVGGIPGGF